MPSPPPQEADSIIKGLWDVGLTSFQSGMDSVRNLTGNPIAGVDPHELVDTRPMLKEMEDMLFNNGKVRENKRLQGLGTSVFGVHGPHVTHEHASQRGEKRWRCVTCQGRVHAGRVLRR